MRYQKPVRIAELDILRGIAIVLVLGRHLLTIPPQLPFPIYFVLTFWRRIGWAGVDLFFVLSGFLVSGLLFQNYKRLGKVGPLTFLVRRGFKIYPALYVLLLILYMSSVYLNAWPHSGSLHTLMIEALFLQNYLGGLRIHTWSLAVEEHYYLFLACLITTLAFLRRRQSDPFRILPLIVFALAVTILALRTIIANRWPPGYWVEILPYSHFRFDSLLYGTLLSYFYNFHFDRLRSIVVGRRWPILWSSFLLLAPLFYCDIDSGRFMYTYGFSLLFLGFGNILLLMLIAPFDLQKKWINKFRALAFIGRHSYSIYLWHYSMYLWIAAAMQPKSLIDFYLFVILYLSGSILVGFTSSVLIENPFLALRDRFFPSGRFHSEQKTKIAK